MKFTSSFKAAASVASLVLAASAVQAQNYYSTGFNANGGDIQGNVPTGGAYTFDPNSPNNFLSTQNGWTSNDQVIQTAATAANGFQQAGQSDFVGPSPSLTTNPYQAALGGQGRSPAGTTSAGQPDVIPSVNGTGGTGVVDLFHAVTINTAPRSLQFNTDFDVTTSNASFPTLGSFAFTLGNATTNFLTVNFTPATTTGNVNGQPTGPNVTDVISTTTNSTRLGLAAAGNGTTTGIMAGSTGIVLNAQYHLLVTLTTGANPTFTAIITGAPSNGTGSSQIFSNTGALASDPLTITQAGVLWSVGDKTTQANGGYSNAGSNAIVFDNFSVAVPEPSTYAMMVLGFLGLGLVVRARRQQA